MNRLWSFAISSVMVFWGWVAVTNAETLDFDRAVDRALRHDPRIDEMRQLVKVAEALLKEVEGHGDTMVDMNLFVALTSTIEKRTDTFQDSEAEIYEVFAKNALDFADPKTWHSDNITTWRSLTLKIIKPLHTFGKIENYRQAAEGQIVVKHQDVEIQKRKTVLEVAKAYYGYLAARDSVFFLKKVEQQLNGAREIVQQWIDEEDERGKQSDLFALQAAQHLLNKSLFEADALQTIALKGLKLLTGVSDQEELTLADSNLKPLAWPEVELAVLQQQALDTRPEMQQLKAGLRARKFLIKAHKAERLPNLYMGVVGGIAVSPGREEAENDAYINDLFNYGAFTPVLGLKWDWEGAGVYSGRTRGAEAELDALVEKNRFALLGLPFQVAEKYHTAQAGYKGTQSLAQGSRAARRWMMSTYVDFEAGFEEASKVMDALKTYVIVHVDYLTTLYEYNIHLIELKQIAGERG
jgi:outer membrane protein